MTARVLVVDDILANVKLLEARLSAEYFDVLTAHSGMEALAVLEAERVDVVLLDVMMPGMDGFAVCEALRAAGHRIPVILLTAKDDIDTRLEGMHQGVSEFLTKPINKHELYARVRAQLHILELDRQLAEVERNVRAAGRPPAPAK